MAESKKPIGIDVLTAAKQRISAVFDDFPRVYVSFSGGKDSSVMLQLAQISGLAELFADKEFSEAWEA